MASRYEWADVPASARGQIVSPDELREMADDVTGLHGDVVGVAVMTGSDGALLWGERSRMIAWAEDLLRRLRAGEGAETVDGEVADEMLDGVVGELGTALRRELEAGA